MLTWVFYFSGDSLITKLTIQIYQSIKLRYQRLQLEDKIVILFLVKTHYKYNENPRRFSQLFLFQIVISNKIYESIRVRFYRMTEKSNLIRHLRILAVLE